MKLSKVFFMGTLAKAALAALLVFGLVLAGCGGDDGDSTDTTKIETPKIEDLPALPEGKTPVAFEENAAGEIAAEEWLGTLFGGNSLYDSAINSLVQNAQFKPTGDNNNREPNSIWEIKDNTTSVPGYKVGGSGTYSVETNIPTDANDSYNFKVGDYQNSRLVSSVSIVWTEDKAATTLGRTGTTIVKGSRIEQKAFEETSNKMTTAVSAEVAQWAKIVYGGGLTVVTGDNKTARIILDNLTYQYSSSGTFSTDGSDESTGESSTSYSGTLTVYGGEDGTILVYSKTVNSEASYEKVAGYFGISSNGYW
jgi:hypothetical protein